MAYKKASIIMKQFRSAFILFGVIVTLVAVFQWDNWKTKSDEQKKAAENKLIALTEDLIGEIHYSSLGATDSFDKGGEAKAVPIEARLKKQDGGWRLTSPVSAKADDGAIKSLLTAISDYKYDRVVTEDKARWKEFGLDPANRKLSISYMQDGKPGVLDIFVGAKAPVGYSAYVATSESSKVFLGSQHVLTATAKTLADFRDKTVATVVEKNVNGVTFTVKGKSAVELAKREGKYVIILPEAMPADDTAVKDFIEELNRVKATDIVDQPSPGLIAQFTPANLVGKITWSVDGGPISSLLLAEFEKSLWASFDPKALALKLPDDSRTKLLKGLSDLRDRRIFLFSAKDVTSVDIDGLVFKKVKEEWFSTETAAKTPPDDKPKGHVQSLLVDLEFAKGEDFLPINSKNTKGLGAPQRRIKLEFTPDSKLTPLFIETWDDKELPEKILIKHTAGNYVYRAGKSLFSNSAETTIKSASDSEPSSPLSFGKADDSGDTGEEKSAN